MTEDLAVRVLAAIEETEKIAQAAVGKLTGSWAVEPFEPSTPEAVPASAWVDDGDEGIAMVTDIVARIDAALRPVCVWCHNTIPWSSPSQDFCGEDCQHNWTRRQAGDETPVFGGILQLPEPTHRTEQDRRVDVLLRETFTSEQWARGWWTRCDPPTVLTTSNRVHVYIEARSPLLDQSCVRILDGADAIIRIVPNELLARPGSIEDLVATFIREKTSRSAG